MTTVGLVTGAARGMGAACAEALVDEVDVLILADLNVTATNELVQSMAAAKSRARVIPLELDVTDTGGLTQLVNTIEGAGSLRAVVHAAGISPTMADWADIIGVDLIGTARLVDSLRPVVTRGTAMVCFASMAPFLLPGGVKPEIGAALDAPLHPKMIERLHAAVGPALADPGSAYMWAKRGVHRLVQREAIAFGSRGARICSVSPGIIDTPMGREEASARSTNDFLVGQTPLGREGRADEVAGVVTFLLSAQANFVTGIDVLVDGGVVAAITHGNLEIPDR